MTPFPDPVTDQERLYNQRHRQTRVRVECTIGILKRVFNILHQEVRVKLESVPKIVAAASVFHNIRIREGVVDRVKNRLRIEEFELHPQDQRDIDQPPIYLPQNAQPNAFRAVVAAGML